MSDSTADRWRQTCELFDELAELDAASQQQRLAVVGSSDPALRQAVEALLAADRVADARLARLDAGITHAMQERAAKVQSDALGLVGRTISHFRVLEAIGAGGMGMVYRAEDMRLQREVALKLPLVATLLDPSARTRFLREARAAGALDHPNVCRVHEVGESEDGYPFLAMTLYEGETLKDRLAREGALPVAAAIDVARQVALGLECAHAAGVVHRDLKPGNIIVLPDGTAKILDFGLAKLADVSQTDSGATRGTARYMAPEQIRGDAVDARADLWSLGVVLYESLTGVRPFPGDDVVATTHAVLHATPVPPSRLRPSIPRALDHLVLSLLAKQPSQRYPRARQLADDLDAIGRGLKPVFQLSLLQRVAAGWTRHGTTAISAALPRHSRRLVLVAGFAIGGALIVGMALRGMNRSGPVVSPNSARALAEPHAEPREQGSIAVLPLIDLSPDKDQEHFSDGVTEELISHLSRVTGLKVVARTSSARFKGTMIDVRDVGIRLGVAHVLEGSVRREGDRLRINVQLINVETGFHAWSQVYDRQLRDILDLQDEISRAVAAALSVQLDADGAGTAGRGHTPGIAAYELYLRGRLFANRRTEDALGRAAEYFQQAIAIEPQFARAYVGLADTYIAPRSGAPAERFLRARELVATALTLDSTLAEAHTSMGWILMWYDRDWAAAERHLLRALALDPNYLWARQWYGAYLGAVGRPDESLANSLLAQRLDPLSVTAITHIGTQLFWLGRYEEAIHQYHKALELDPNFFMAHWGLSRAYLQLGQYADALRELQVAGTDYLGLFRPALSGFAYAVAGQEAEARQLLAELHERQDRGEYIAPTEFAAIHVGLGERSEALDWLERHEADRGARIFLKVDPIFDPLRTEQRFQSLLRRLGLE